MKKPVEKPKEWGPLEILQNSVEPGQKKILTVSIVKSHVKVSMDKMQVEMPAMVVRGSRPGPTLGVTGGIHGDELNGSEVARRIAFDAQPDRLAGTLLALPAINAMGLRTRNRYMPDRRDLNRCFPGSPKGSLASIVAHAVFKLVKRCDALVDLHTASNDRINLPQIRTDLTNKKATELALSFDVGVVLHGLGPPGSLRGAALAAGIPSVIYEAGEPMRFGIKEIEQGVDGVRRVMAHLGMIDYRPPVFEKAELFEKTRWVRVKRGYGGLFFPRRTSGDRVAKGEELGAILEPWSDTKHPIVSPVHGRIIGMAAPQPVLSGYGLFHLGVYT